MYKKSALKKIGSIVVVAALIASAFAVISVEDVAGGNGEGSTTDHVVINEFLVYPDGEFFSDKIELYNPTDSGVDLTGWNISVLPATATNTNALSGTIDAYGYVVIDVTFNLPDDTGTIVLNDEANDTVDNVTYGGETGDAPVPGPDNSTGRYPNGVDTDSDAEDFQVFTSPTFGESNGGETHDVYIDTGYTGTHGTGIRIDNATTEEIALDQNLTIGETYHIKYKVVNDGTAGPEEVGVTVTVDSTEVADYTETIDEYHLGDKTWDTSGLSPGDYTITVNASLPADDNMTGNERTRTVTLERGGDTTPPEISNVTATPATAKAGGKVNISCDVSDNVGIDTVNVTITGPEGFDTITETMSEGSYYYAQEYTITGTYHYNITAKDTSDLKTSEEGTFQITTNFEVKPTSGGYKDTVTMEIYNASDGDTVQVWKPGATQYTKQDWANSKGRVTFSNVYLDAVGEWTVKDITQDISTTFTVKPAPLNITLSPATETFNQSKSGIQVDVTIKDQDGNYVSDADFAVSYIGTDGQDVPAQHILVSESGGNYTIKVRGMDGIGTYNVSATKNNTGDATPELGGYAHLDVTPNDLTFDDVSVEDAKSGFPSTKKFLVKYADVNTSVDWTRPVNITLSVGGESNSTGDVDFSSDTGTVILGGETAHISVEDGDLVIEMKWPETGEYDLTVKQDYAGSTMIDNESYEYTGSTTFDVATPPDVNVKVTPDTVDVNETSFNTVTLEVEVLGDAVDVYGSPKNLSINAATLKNVTKRFEIEGDILYTPPAGAFEYVGHGIWEVKVFPTRGNGMIYVNVTWPNNGTDGDNVTIDEGGHVTVDPTTVIVDNQYNFTVALKTKEGDSFQSPQYLRLYLENKSYYETGGWELVREKTSLYSPNGEFTFSNVSIDHAAVNYVVAAYFKTGTTDQHAFARIQSNPAHDLEVDWSPGEVMAGASTEYTFNVTRDNSSYADSFQLYLLNETQYEELQDDELNLDTLTPLTASQANFTKTPPAITEAGTYYLYVRTTDKKHDNMGAEPSIEVSKATVTPDMATVVKHIDTNGTVTFDVTWNGDNLDGTLTIKGIKDTGEYNETYMKGEKITVDVTNGTATVHNLKVVNGSQAGYEITFTLKPENGKDADADGTMTVTIPDITVEPETISLGEQNIITVTVTNPRNDNPVADMKVTGDFPAGEMTLGKTDSNGEITIGIIPDMTGTITLYVEGDQAGNITIDVGGLDIHVIGDRYFYALPELKKGTEYTIKVTTKGGKEIQGATVSVGGNTYTTNADGEVTWKPDKTGDFTITATYGTYDQGTRDVTVKKEPTTPGFGFGILLLGMLGVALILWRRRR